MTSSPTILITGSSSGFGRVTAEALARLGYTVFASMRGVDGKNAQAAADLLALAADEGLALHVVELDVTDEQSIQAAVQRVIDTSGQIDVLLNNAGGGMVGITESCSMAQIEALFDLNVFGALRVNQAVLPHMRRQGSGLLLYIGSVSASVAFPYLAVYGATKSALEMLAESMHYELFSLGIDSVILQLGTYATNWIANVQYAAKGEVAQAYGRVNQIGTAMTDGMEAYSDAFGADAHEVADLIARLIAMPAGQRPLRLATGSLTEGLDRLNEVRDVLQAQKIAALQQQSLLERLAPDPAS